MDIGVVVVTHGQLAAELVNAAETIVGDLPRFAAVSIGWHEDVEDARAEIRAAIERVRGPKGVLILTDMFGGTATNVALPFLDPDRVEVVTGTNLPMLVKLASIRCLDLPLHELAQRLTAAGQKSIRVASEFLKRREPS